jgi:hypothetical protein
MRKGKMSSIRWKSNNRAWDKKGNIKEPKFNHTPQYLQQLEEKNRPPKIRRKYGDEWVEL